MSFEFKCHSRLASRLNDETYAPRACLPLFFTQFVESDGSSYRPSALPVKMTKAINWLAATWRFQIRPKRPSKAASAAIVNNDKMLKKDIDDLNKMLQSAGNDSNIDWFEIFADMMHGNFEMTFARLDAVDAIDENLRKVGDEIMDIVKESAKENFLSDLDDSFK